MHHHLFFVPGFLGFTRFGGTTGGIDYFVELPALMEATLRGLPGVKDVTSHLVQVTPTGSITARADAVARTISEQLGALPSLEGHAVHLIGHSTGGLDARLVVSPASRLPTQSDSRRRWLDAVRTVVTLNTPHAGTPIASFFASRLGGQLLDLVSTLASDSLARGAFSFPRALATAAARAPRPRGSLWLNRHPLLSAVGALTMGGPALIEYLQSIAVDQGALVQLSPEAMALANAAPIADHPGIRYLSVASMARDRGTFSWLYGKDRPDLLFRLLQRIVSHSTPAYPCSTEGSGQQTDQLARFFGDRQPALTDNDGVVPIHSQVWGELIWAGFGDHMDTVGHFGDEPTGKAEWMVSGAGFTQGRFAAIAGAIAEGLGRPAMERRIKAA